MITISKIVWSPRAASSYYDVLYYLKDNWSNRELEAFINRTEEVLKHITTNPLLYPYSATADTYRAVVNRQITLFYRVKSQRVELLIFWDNRQNPACLNKNIKLP